jgi:hypothetical protein
VDAAALVRRVVSPTTAGTFANLLLMVAALPVFGAGWLLPALPGIVINVAAEPGSLQAALSDHYAWPVLPWLFVAAAAGIQRVSSRSPRAALAWTLVLLVATLADNPAVRRVTSTRMNPDAVEVRRQLAEIDARGVIMAQPNLIPHLPHSQTVYAIGGGDARPPRDPDLVLLTTVGNLWPLTRAETEARIATYASDPRYEARTRGPLFVFARVSPAAR